MTSETSRVNFHAWSAALHLAILWGLALLLMINWTEGARVLAYMNVAAVGLYAIFRLYRSPVSRPRLVLQVMAIPAAFTLFHAVAVGNLELVKDLRTLWVAVFIVFGVWIAANRDRMLLGKCFWPSMAALLMVYTLIQAVGIVIEYHPLGGGLFSPYANRSYGVTSNPHYLAIYSALCLTIALYGSRQRNGWIRWCMAALVPILAYFVLMTSSRPAWLALMAGAIVAFVFLNRGNRLRIAIGVVLIPALLYWSNIAHFGDRMKDLVTNATTEERVVIWQDTWNMQKNSTVLAWSFGHGIDRFQSDFSRNSNTYGKVNFRHPHNTFLEVLYVSGILGVALCLAIYAALYSSLFRMRQMPAIKSVAVLLATLLTVHFVIIMLTLPFFSRYNLYPLAWLSGIVILLRSSIAKQNS